jgi:hypothetical protein
VLDDPAEFAPLGRAAAAFVREHYDLDRCLDLFVRVCQDARSRAC